jgi:hypothetical protein
MRSRVCSYIDIFLMFYIIYLSAAVKPADEAELLSILTVSRHNNKPLGITGVLLYGDNKFIQLLEGEKETVQQTFEKISYDPRHKAVTMITCGEIAERIFPEWSMGFKALNTQLLSQFNGYLNPSDPGIFNDKDDQLPTRIHTYK